MNRKAWRPVDKILLPITLLIVAAAAFIISGEFMTQPQTDISIHTGFAVAFLDGEYASSYPGYYLTFGLFSRLFGLPDAYAAAAAQALFALLTAVAVYGIAGWCLGWDGPEIIRCFVVLFMSFCGPLYLGGRTYYLGQGSFNTWHNPTNNSVKWLALICFFLFIYWFGMGKEEKVAIHGRFLKRNHLSVVLTVFTTASLLCKPSFFQVFAPFLVIVYGIDLFRRRRSFKDCLIDALVFVPAVLFVLYQMFFTFGSEEATGGIRIAFGEAMRYQTDNIVRSILTQLIFPLFVCIFCVKDLKKNKMLLYSMLYYFVSIGEGLLLVESGERAGHGNFLWGMNLGVGVALLAATLKFIRYLQSNKGNHTLGYKAVALTGGVLLFFHLAFGGLYWLVCAALPIEYF